MNTKKAKRVQLGTTVSPATHAQARELLAEYGTLREVLTRAIDRLYESQKGMMTMDTKELIRTLEFEYWGIRAASPDWTQSLYSFLRSRGLTSKQIGHERIDIIARADSKEPTDE